MFSISQLLLLCMTLAYAGSVLSIFPGPHLTTGPKMFGHGGLKPNPSVISNATAASNDSSIGNIAHRVTPGAPHFVIYSDKSTNGVTGPPHPSEVKGFNVCALAFLLVAGAFDKAQEWTSLTAGQRKSIKSQYSAAGIKLIVSVFGATDAPTTHGADPVATANRMAKFVKDFDLDGVDVDYEDFEAINAGDGKGEAWIIKFTRQLRTHLPREQFLLTHAPVAPWFAPGKFGGGAYLTVHKEVGHLIDWYNVQFYNQGSKEYTTCSGLLTSSSDAWPQTSLFQIAKNGVPLEKLVIGKPGTSDDSSNGYMTPATLSKCLQQARNEGWRGGAMSWEFPDADADWIHTVRSQAFSS